jgi:hypothetical protein
VRKPLRIAFVFLWFYIYCDGLYLLYPQALEERVSDISDDRASFEMKDRHIDLDA